MLAPKTRLVLELGVVGGLCAGDALKQLHVCPHDTLLLAKPCSIVHGAWFPRPICRSCGFVVQAAPMLVLALADADHLSHQNGVLLGDLVPSVLL